MSSTVLFRRASIIVVILLGVSMASVSDGHVQGEIVSSRKVPGQNTWQLTGTADQVSIQAAVDGVSNHGDGGGTVWVGGDARISAPIRLKTNVILDFEGHKLEADSDITFIFVSTCQYASVRNVRIQLNSGESIQTEPVIHLQLPADEASPRASITHNSFENIHILNVWETIAITEDSTAGRWKGCRHVGVHFDLPAGSGGNASISLNSFKDIQIFGPRVGILLEMDTPPGSHRVLMRPYGHGNYFENIWIGGPETVIEFDVRYSSEKHGGFKHNVFSHVKAQFNKLTTRAGIVGISGRGNHFDHVLIWDWKTALSSRPEWHVTADAPGTHICAHHITQLVAPPGTVTLCK